MPEVIKFHIVHAFSWNGMSDNDAWAIPHCFCVIAGVYEFSNIVTVDIDDFKIECFKFVAQWFDWHDVFGIAVDLNVIAINDPGEVSEFVSSGE